MELIDMRGNLPVNPNPRRKYKRRDPSKISKIVLHCTNGMGRLVPLARYFVTPSETNHISTNGLPEFAYHFWIDADGTIYYCTDIRNISWHAGNHNAGAVGIALRYRADGNPNPPPGVQLEAAEYLISQLCLGHNVDPITRLPSGLDPDLVFGHRELYGTGWKWVNGVKKLRKTCPGSLVSMTKVRYNVSLACQKRLKDENLYKGALDGLFGPKSERALTLYAKQF